MPEPNFLVILFLFLFLGCSHTIFAIIVPENTHTNIWTYAPSPPAHTTPSALALFGGAGEGWEGVGGGIGWGEAAYLVWIICWGPFLIPLPYFCSIWAVFLGIRKTLRNKKRKEVWGGMGPYMVFSGQNILCTVLLRQQMRCTFLPGQKKNKELLSAMQISKQPKLHVRYFNMWFQNS